MRRVAVTGIGVSCSLGSNMEEIFHALLKGETGVSSIDELKSWDGLRCHLGAALPHINLPPHFTPKTVRSMGAAAILATMASEWALADAEIDSRSEVITSGATGVAFGSGIGSIAELSQFVSSARQRQVKGLSALSYHRIMSHSCAANIAIHLKCSGRLIPTSSACTSGSLAIGLAFEEIQSGRQKVMIAGGAEEFTPEIVAIFDVMFATSRKNNTPRRTPSPFDAERDGMVVGGGVCSLVLEDLDHALSRGARIYCEIGGFATNNDGFHVTHPNPVTVERVMRMCLQNAEANPGDIDYVNAHATGTRVGDEVEAQATYAVFGDLVPVSSLKGHLGHTLGACGALEAAITIEMMNRQVLIPTRNLSFPDPELPPLCYLQNEPVERNCKMAMSNTFAFGGVNTSLIFKRSQE